MSQKNYTVPEKVKRMVLEASALSEIFSTAEIVERAIIKFMGQYKNKELSHFSKGKKERTTRLSVRLQDKKIELLSSFGKNKSKTLSAMLSTVLPSELRKARRNHKRTFRTHFIEGVDYTIERSEA